MVARIKKKCEGDEYILLEKVGNREAVYMLHGDYEVRIKEGGKFDYVEKKQGKLAIIGKQNY